MKEGNGHQKPSMLCLGCELYLSNKSPSLFRVPFLGFFRQLTVLLECKIEAEADHGKREYSREQYQHPGVFP